MVWKPKEKELTAEEAIVLAKKDLIPFWIGSPPRIAGIKSEEEFAVITLDKDFEKEIWLFVFIDITTFAGEAALAYAKEWHKRFHQFNINILLVIEPIYRFLRVPDFTRPILQEKDLDFPCLIDIDQAIGTSFKAQTLPHVLLLVHGRVFLSHSNPIWINQSELGIQKFLRSSDLGLPLAPPFQFLDNRFNDAVRKEFGSEVNQVGLPATQTFPILPGPEWDKKEVWLGGTWTQESERIVTSDPTAVLIFRTPFVRIWVVAERLDKRIESSTIAVEVDGSPVYESIFGKNMRMQETGESVVPVGDPQVIELLNYLPQDKTHQIVLRFHKADQTSIAVYGLRFGERVGASAVKRKLGPPLASHGNIF